MSGVHREPSHLRHERRQRVSPLCRGGPEERRTKAEVDQIIRWHTGFDQAELERHLEAGTDFQTFFADTARLNPARSLITGKVCGVDVAAVEDPLMREIRYLDKLIDELAKGRPMAKILRA
ncbi:DUF2200 domain-containing protein [Brevundimonas bacteroides]|uniref:DUF2200 domain-containing protein n=1 Tax=Brevundimonas bacteroides TaxID=74311 RepID=UPI000B10103A